MRCNPLKSCRQYSSSALVKLFFEVFQATSWSSDIEHAVTSVSLTLKQNICTISFFACTRILALVLIGSHFRLSFGFQGGNKDK